MPRHAVVPCGNAVRPQRRVAVPKLVAWTIAGSLPLLPSTPVRAEEAPPVDVGARVRVTVARGPDAGERTERVEKTVGQLIAIEADRITLAVQGRRSPVVVPLDSVLRLERSVRPSKRGKGALVGGAIGMAVGFILIAADDSC